MIENTFWKKSVYDIRGTCGRLIMRDLFPLLHYYQENEKLQTIRGKADSLIKKLEAGTNGIGLQILV